MLDGSVLITGSRGSLGTALAERIPQAAGVDVRDGVDVCDLDTLLDHVFAVHPRVIFHLAGAKYATIGERDPYDVAAVNIEGTKNVLDCAEAVGARVILASTCKAIHPETVYGATKLIAERMVLNAGHSVARLYNVRESSGNVFRIWEQVPEGMPLPVTDCQRYFISLKQALDLLIAVAKLPPGRYTIDPGPISQMIDEAHKVSSFTVPIPRRLGDRKVEPRLGDHEVIDYVLGGVEHVVAEHDQISEEAAA